MRLSFCATNAFFGGKGLNLRNFRHKAVFMELFNKLRQRHKSLIYHGFEVFDGGFSFHFSIDDYHFRPAWSFPKGLISDSDSARLRRMVFSLGMAELVSYWKCACPPVVEVRCGELDEEACLWWKKLYFGGLGEFFYRNGIEADFESFMTIKPVAAVVLPLPKNDKEYRGALIPVGGGKDSVVTLEILRESRAENHCYIINPRPATLDCARLAGFPDERVFGVRRTIDRTLLELNAKGYLNGHTPISAVIAFSGFLFADLLGKRYVVLSNESSANEGNTGGGVNHQYSKSTEFERDFRLYTARMFGNLPEYFSLLRPLSEWQIAREFVKHRKYFPVFQSCNLGSKTNSWCANCAKCLYVYIMLAGFLPDSEISGIIGENMLDNPAHRGLFNALVHENYDKPFECVGTREEINRALHDACRLRKGDRLPVLLGEWAEGNPPPPADIENYFDDENFVPAEFLAALKERIYGEQPV